MFYDNLRVYVRPSFITDSVEVYLVGRRGESGFFLQMENGQCVEHPHELGADDVRPFFALPRDLLPQLVDALVEHTPPRQVAAAEAELVATKLHLADMRILALGKHLHTYQITPDGEVKRID